MIRLGEISKTELSSVTCFFCHEPLGSGDLFRFQVESEEWHNPNDGLIALDEKRVLLFEPVPRCATCKGKTVEQIVIERLSEVGPIRQCELSIPWVTTHFVAPDMPTAFTYAVHSGSLTDASFIGQSSPTQRHTVRQQLLRRLKRTWRACLVWLVLFILLLWLSLTQP